jgi:hypothetical protein
MNDVFVKTFIMGRMLDKIVEFVPLSERQLLLITNQPPPNFIQSRAPNKVIFLSQGGKINIIPTGMIQHWTWAGSRALKAYTTKWFAYE